MTDALAGMKDKQWDIFCELEITERLMITGGELGSLGLTAAPSVSASSTRPSYVAARVGHVLRQLSATTRFVASP
jgi:hypothetical protein